MVIHGGAGSRTPTNEKALYAHQALERILEMGFKMLSSGRSARETVMAVVKELENDPFFNAGRGSRLQADGKIRMSASIMDSRSKQFSGVINIEGVKNPIEVAEALSREESRVLSGKFATRFARKGGFLFRSPYTKERILQYKNALRGKSGTVGAVALDKNGILAAATSTGGRGMEMPGRVSDSPTIAGNYANHKVAISTTGVGEQIVNFALAPKIAIRVLDGTNLKNTFSKTFKEAKPLRYEFGAIGLSGKGEIQIAKTTEFMYWAFKNKKDKKICPKI